MEYVSPNSIWLRSKNKTVPKYPPLAMDRRVDVVIIGAGITGLTAALHLKEAGRQVVVLEAGRVGAGTTGGTSGHLDVVPDQGFGRLVRDFGDKAAKSVTAARTNAIDQIEHWAQTYAIDCDFRRIPACVYTERPKQVDSIRAECEQARRLGIDSSTRQNSGLPFETAAAMELRNQARFHVMDYLWGIARAVHGDGVVIHEHSRAETPEDGTPCVVNANEYRLFATDIIIATHSAYLGVSQFDLRQAAYNSHVLSVRVQENIPDALYQDDEQPYHYIRQASSADPNLLIIGGADNKAGQGNQELQIQKLVNYASQRFDVIGIEEQWSAELFEPADGLPMIGRVPMSEHLYMATGFSGTGLTYGTAAGGILAGMILDRGSNDVDIFSPTRFKPFVAAKDFISENLNVARHFVGDRMNGERVKSLDVIKVGEGKIVKLDGKTMAVYRDEDNNVHRLSPVCRHAGCYVKWNSSDRTWDCPCHGGRYSPTGERLYGPPSADLEDIEKVRDDRQIEQH